MSQNSTKPSCGPFVLIDVFRKVEAGSHEQARSGLKDLAAKHVALNKLIDAQLARLS
jgi:ABC-type sulfate transport system substrate-binding protein